jgi:hypothetical protein
MRLPEARETIARCAEIAAAGREIEPSDVDDLLEAAVLVEAVLDQAEGVLATPTQPPTRAAVPRLRLRLRAI